MTRPHDWLDGRCERCGMLATWPGASLSCTGVVHDPRTTAERASRRRARLRHRAALLASMGLVAILALVPSQAAACPRTDDALVLARLAVHEASWRAEGDVGPIHEVIAGIASRRGTTWRLAACAHSPRLTAGTVRRRWVAELDADGTRPAHWPAGSSWERWRPAWLAVLARARLLVAGAVGPQCERVPETWGSDDDIRRAARAGRRPIVVPCGTTANRFVVWGRR